MKGTAAGNDSAACPRTEKQLGSWKGRSSQRDIEREVGQTSVSGLTVQMLENLKNLQLSRAKCRHRVLHADTWLTFLKVEASPWAVWRPRTVPGKKGVLRKRMREEGSFPETVTPVMKEA